MPVAISRDGASEDWYAYKYPRSYNSGTSQARLEHSSDLDRFAGTFGSWEATASGRNKGIQPERHLTRLNKNMGGSISRLTTRTSAPPPTASTDTSNPRGAQDQAQQRGSATKSDIPIQLFSTPTWNNSNGQNGAIHRPAEENLLRSSAPTNTLPCARFANSFNARNVHEEKRHEEGVRNAKIETGNLPSTVVSKTSNYQQIKKQQRCERSVSQGRASESHSLTARKATGILSPATVLKDLNSQHKKRKRQTDRDFESSIFVSRKKSKDEDKAKSIAPRKTALCKDSTYNSMSHKTAKHESVENPEGVVSPLVPRKAAKTTGYKVVQPSIEIEEGDKLSRQLAMPDFEDWNEVDSVSSQSSSRAFTQSVDCSGSGANHTTEEAQMKETDLKSSWQTLAEDCFADIFEDIDFLRTALPEVNSESPISSPLGLNSSLSPLAPPSAFDNSEIPYLFENVFSPNENVSYSPSFVDPRAAFYNPFDQPESIEIASLEKMVQENTQALGILGTKDCPQLLKDGSHKEVLQERKIPPRQYPQVIIYQKTNIASTMGKSELGPTPVKSYPAPVTVTTTKESQSPGPDPECLTLARLVSGEPQYLVQWKDQSEESWVTEKSLLRSAPELVREWKSRQVEVHAESKVAPPVLKHIVEKILGKKKFKGVPHYLVKWEGYSLEKDRTWEPCDRLRIDVPTLVDEYESTNRRKRRRKL